MKPALGQRIVLAGGGGFLRPVLEYGVLITGALRKSQETKMQIFIISA